MKKSFQVSQGIHRFNMAGVEFVYDLAGAACIWAFTLCLDLDGGFERPAVLTLGVLMRWFYVLEPTCLCFSFSVLITECSCSGLLPGIIIFTVCLSGWCFSAPVFENNSFGTPSQLFLPVSPRVEPAGLQLWIEGLPGMVLPPVSCLCWSSWGLGLMLDWLDLTLGSHWIDCLYLWAGEQGRLGSS